VKIYYKDAFEKHGKLFDELGINVNNGMSLYEKSKLYRPHYVKKLLKIYMHVRNTVLHLQW
jgi:monomeric isocitrate dehydrogenase